jgi:hypothetical protein
VRFRGQRLLRKVWILGFFLGVVGLPWVNARLVAADVVIQKGATGWGESVATREKERREFLRLGDLASSVMNFFVAPFVGFVFGFTGSGAPVFYRGTSA